MNKLIPVLLVVMFPLDLVAGLSRGIYPSQATLAALGGAVIGVYLARQLWWGGAERLKTRSRLQLVNQQGHSFDPASEEAQARLDNAQASYLLGAGFLWFGLFLTLIFIVSYLVVVPIQVAVSPTGQLVQLGVMVLFNLLVLAVEGFGAKVFLQR